jgi:hypothetical protein
MEPLVVRMPVALSVGFIVVGLGIATACVLLACAPMPERPEWWTEVSLCMAAAAAAMCASATVMLVRGRPLLVVDDRGVHITALRAPIPWSGILGVRGVGIAPLRLQWLVVRDLDAVLAKAPAPLRLGAKLMAKLRIPPLVLPTGGVISAKRLAEVVEAGLRAHGGSAR